MHIVALHTSISHSPVACGIYYDFNAQSRCLQNNFAQQQYLLELSLCVKCLHSLKRCRFLQCRLGRCSVNVSVQSAHRAKLYIPILKTSCAIIGQNRNIMHPLQRKKQMMLKQNIGEIPQINQNCITIKMKLRHVHFTQGGVIATPKCYQYSNYTSSS